MTRNRSRPPKATAGPRSVPPSEGPDWLAEFDYELPPAQIARRPLEPRDSSRLLVLDRASGARSQTVFRDLPRLLRAGDLLVLNETRVLRARLFARLERTGRPVEALFSHPDGEEWLALLGPGRRLRPGDRLLVAGEAEADRGRGGREGLPAPDRSGASLALVAPAGDGLWRLRAVGQPIETLLDRWGHVPLPPYIGRADTPEDRAWYQTVFARRDGAVAAPTAGLHFTPELLSRLEQAGVTTARVVLHVGPGTFLPVRAASPEAHRVLPERYEVPAETALAMRRTRRAGGRIVAVGTTVVRALETAARRPGTMAVGRSDAAAPASAPGVVSDGEDGASPIEPGSGWTDLTIAPGHRFRGVDALITNFHLPRSSLLLLVSAFAGRDRILEAYVEARNAGFRFYSYGDAMLIL